MASSSSSIPSALHGQSVSEKLTKSNFVLWKAQVLATLHDAQMAGFLDGSNKAPEATIVITKDDGKTTEKVANPALAQWVAQEQQVLSYLLSSLSRDVLTQVATLGKATEVWEAIESLFALQSRARVINTRMALSTTKKGNKSVAEYVSKMKSLADEIATTGKPLDEEDLVSYILAGLDYDYNPLVSSVATRVEPLMVAELYALLLSFEQRMELLQGDT